MANKTPAVTNGRGMETLTGNFQAPFTLARYRAQHLAARLALPLETAAIVAAIAFAGGNHG